MTNFSLSRSEPPYYNQVRNQSSRQDHHAIHTGMKLFHGSASKIEFPKILDSVTAQDFGSGFYTTPDYAQAGRWMRLASRGHKCGYINIFEFDPATIGTLSLKVRDFHGATSEWVDFIHENRTGALHDHGFDIVSGPIPTDDIYELLDAYDRGRATKDSVIGAISRTDFSRQILFHTGRALMQLEYLGCRQIQNFNIGS